MAIVTSLENPDCRALATKVPGDKRDTGFLTMSTLGTDTALGGAASRLALCGKIDSTTGNSKYKPVQMELLVLVGHEPRDRIFDPYRGSLARSIHGESITDIWFFLECLVRCCCRRILTQTQNPRSQNPIGFREVWSTETV